MTSPFYIKAAANLRPGLTRSYLLQSRQGPIFIGAGIGPVLDHYCVRAPYSKQPTAQ